MNVINAFWISFWIVINRLFRRRPIRIKCCVCGKLYWLTVEKIVDTFSDDTGRSHIVIICPSCGLRHCVVFARLEKDTKIIHVETS